jgi:hypothetical protein
LCGEGSRGLQIPATLRTNHCVIGIISPALRTEHFSPSDSEV